MVKTQVQIPEDLYEDAKRIAHQYEMSFAEVVRRGLERVVWQYPLKKTVGPWHPPKPEKRGAADLSAAELRDLARSTTDLAVLLKERGK
jgi:hypothetical protein